MFTKKWDMKRLKRLSMKTPVHQYWVQSSCKCGCHSRSRMSYCSKCWTSQATLLQVLKSKRRMHRAIRTSIWDRRSIRSLAVKISLIGSLVLRSKMQICRCRLTIRRRSTRFRCFRQWMNSRIEGIGNRDKDKWPILIWNHNLQCRVMYTPKTRTGLKRKLRNKFPSRVIYLLWMKTPTMMQEKNSPRSWKAN